MIEPGEKLDLKKELLSKKSQTFSRRGKSLTIRRKRVSTLSVQPRRSSRKHGIFDTLNSEVEENVTATDDNMKIMQTVHKRQELSLNINNTKRGVKSIKKKIYNKI